MWQKSERREMVDLLVLSRPAESLQVGVGFGETLEKTGLAEKERVASAPQSGQLVRTLEPKGKGNEH